MTCGVYHIIDKTTNKRYVGSSKNIETRWYRHRSSLRKNKHHSPALQNAWNVRGEENFFFLIAEVCCESKLIEVEDCHLQPLVEFERHLNARKQASAGGNRKGMKTSDETCAKMSAAQKGKPRKERRTWSDEQKKVVRDFMKQRHANGLVNAFGNKK